MERNSHEYTDISFDYRGEKVDIPFATTLNEVGSLLKERTVPVWNIARPQGIITSFTESGIALSTFQFYTDSFLYRNPDAADTIKSSLIEAGFNLPDSPGAHKSYQPTKMDLLDNLLRGSEEDYYKTTDLAERVFVIGPIIAWPADTDVPEGFFDYTAEIEATNAVIDGAFAMDGRIFYEKLYKNKSDRIKVIDMARLVSGLLAAAK